MEMMKTYLQSSTITVLNSVRDMHIQGRVLGPASSVRTGVLQHIGTRKDSVEIIAEYGKVKRY